MKYPFLFLLFIHIYSQNYHRVIHNEDSQALCLDGSPPVLYAHQGNQPNNFLVFMFGGGFCGDVTLSSTLENCYQRSKTLLGSSKYWPETYNGQGYLSADPSVSKFAQWTKILLGYCDGSLHQGYTKQPIQYKDTKLYFRGNAIMRSHIAWLNKTYGFLNADNVVLTGGSAGAIGAFLWNNYFQQRIVRTQKIQTIIDSGIFLDEVTHSTKKPQIRTKIQNMFSLSNRDQLTPFSECNYNYPKQQWRCLFFQYNYLYLRGSILIINSEYDSWSIPNILKIQCLKPGKIGGQTLEHCNKSQIQSIENYRKKYINVVKTFIQLSFKRSIWSISCSNHVYACLNIFYNNPLQKIPELVGYTTKDAIQKFVFDRQQVVKLDINGWPSNNPCAY